MNALETLPVYRSVSQEERGDSFGLSFENYRRLARTALAIIKGLGPLTMVFYRLPDGSCCGLDIFGRVNCLTILIDSSSQTLSLFRCQMDAAFGSAVCILSADSSEEKSWRKLLRLARKEIQ